VVTSVHVREVDPNDLPVFYRHQLDEEANRMARFRPRDRDAFMAHWERILADPTVIARTIVAGGEVVGNVVSWAADRGVRLVGYWIGREHWGHGFATAGLSGLLEADRERPLHALVAVQNVGSIRVLEKCGFVRSDEDVGSEDGVEELVYRYG
jgi:RimJ/RimL family protein N-acetyltransferase